MPPPPPEPPPPPKLPGNLSNARGKSANFEHSAPDRNALLSQIRKGARLNKVETNDKSKPFIEGVKTSVSNGSNSNFKRNLESKSNGPIPIIPPGGLFAQGIPKLRPTQHKHGDGVGTSSPVIQSIRSNTSIEHLRVGQLGGSRSQPPSPVSKPRLSPGRTVNHITNEHSSGNPNFPDDINVKGPAPAPPPASQKPCFKSNSSINEEALNTNGSSKNPTVKRSASQTNLGQRPRLACRPPNVRPPPPPKTAAPQVAPPPPPSKPPNILRRQSFGTPEIHNSRFVSDKLSVLNNNTTSKPQLKAGGPPPPPPPPRNFSAPNDLNQMTISSSSPVPLNKMNIAPPPPPNRAAVTSNRAAPTRPPPPRTPAPPPPPQHRYPAPPSQMKAMPSNSIAPPPPTRVSSIKSSDFEARFLHMFTPAHNLPKPDKFLNKTKIYPSIINQSRQKQNPRRQPPPPPPQVGNNASNLARGQPIETGYFSHS